MNELPPKHPRPDTTGWPVIEARPDDVWLGSYDQSGNRLDGPTPTPSKSGRAEFLPVQMLPEVVFDCANPDDANPAFLAARRAEFVLTVTPPVGTDPGRVATDVKPLLLAMQAYEIELGGDGLRFEEIDAPAGAFAFRVSATRWDGAPDRLRRLRAALADTEPVAVLRQAIQTLRDHDIAVAV